MIGLIGLFLSWTEVSVKVISNGMTFTDTLTGFKGLIDDAAYEPMMVLIGAIVTVIVGLLVILGKSEAFGKDGIIAKVVLIIMSIIIIAGSVKVLLDIGDVSQMIPPELAGLVTASASAGIGLYMALASGVIILAAAVLSIAKVLPDDE